MRYFLDILYHYIWGMPVLLLILGVSVYYTVALRGLQFRYLGYALSLVFGKNKNRGGEGDISHFQSLMTALAGTVGIGNIAGVSTALAIGGAGALFWMWITALLGMAIKYAEAILAIKYRFTDDKGEMCGGPMHYIEKGLGWRWLSIAFAVSGVFVATFGGGNMLQANSVADVMQSVFSVDPLITGIVVALVTGATLIGGIKSIGKVASVVVPFMALFYIGGGALILFKHFDRIPQALWMIFSCAFTGHAAVGGFLGSSIFMAIQVGISRGVMTSEAGMGTASIAAAAAKTDHPGRQAMVSMTGGFLATVVMCSVTGLVLGVTNVLGTPGADGQTLTGASMTAAAFRKALPSGELVVTIGLVLFAFTTLLGWAYYGEKCLEYLIGTRLLFLYRILFSLVIIPGAVLHLELVWMLSDIFNGLMVIPNVIGLAALSKVVIAETRDFLAILEKEREEALINEELEQPIFS